MRRGMLRGSRGTYIGPGGEGRRHPGSHGHHCPAALMGIQEGGLRGETAGLKKGSEGGASLRPDGGV
jgi:hypothetical protein